jgi:hypothetical protein
MIAVPILAGLALGASLTGCGEVVETGELREETRTVALGDVKRVSARIDLGVGKLRITGGARDLLEGEFVYNVPRWKPQIDYKLAGDVGELTVEQAEGFGSRLGRGVRCEWDLRLNDDVPMDLDVELGAGESRLELGSLKLRDVVIATGAGEVHVALTGRPTPESVSIKTGAGDTTIDLTGDWRNNLNASIAGGVGRTTVRVPQNVGVHVHADKGIGKISASGLMRDGDSFVNQAYYDSGIILDIGVKTGIGAIILEVGI